MIGQDPGHIHHDLVNGLHQQAGERVPASSGGHKAGSAMSQNTRHVDGHIHSYWPLTITSIIDGHEARKNNHSSIDDTGS